MNKKGKQIKKGKRKIRYDRVLIFLIIVLIICFSIFSLFNLKITNIYIINNRYINDQQIIEWAGISDYPSSITNPSFEIEKRLSQQTFIKDVKVTKKMVN